MEKCKRYDGKRANVTSNLFFEEYMKEVAKGEYFNDKLYFSINNSRKEKHPCLSTSRAHLEV